ncbi:MAG: DNA translocase FtsK [Armatimonadota bacterium]|nr:DNA translocase FtsK [Armatimonadota bacterium]
MARRRDQRRVARNRRAAAGLALLLLALLLGLSFLPGATGLPLTLAWWQRRLFGVAAPALPVYVLVAGSVLIASDQRARLRRPVAGVALASIAALMAVHVGAGAGPRGAGAGLIGRALAGWTARLLGPVGLYATVALLGLGGLALLAGVTTTSLGGSLRLAAGFLVAVAVAAARLLRRVAQLSMVSLARLVAAAVRGLGQLVAGSLRAMTARPAQPGAIPAPAGQQIRHAGVPDEAAGAPVQTPTAGPLALSENLGPGPAPQADARDRRMRRQTGRQESGPGQERLAFAAADYRLPPQSILGDANGGRGRARIDPADTARALEQTLESFGVRVKVVNWEVGPVVTRFEVQPDPGVKVQKITSLTNDIALNLAAQSVRIEAPIPGKSAVGIELPNQKASLVHLREILASEAFQKAPGPLVVAIGKDIAGHPVVADLTEMPHLLIAGATGSGKSVALNAMIASLLFRCTPQQVRLVMIDPKRVELTDYNEIPHLLTPVVTNPRQAASVLKDMLRIMEQRFEAFAQIGARNIQSYNQRTDVEPLYYIVIIIDELADLMMVAPADFEDIICRLAQMTRATGIHLVVATQRPSVDVITGLIKANIPSRLAFAVSSQVDSRTILDTTGAEKLLGRGDMLFLPLGASRAIRAQGAYVADDEIRRIVDWWRQQGAPAYDRQLVEAQRSAPAEEHADGERLMEAARLVVRSGYGSVSLLQRKMRIGYVTAARLIDELEARGIVGPVQGSNPREVLIGLDQLEQMFRRKSAS